jgi:hypothetical protein
MPQDTIETFNKQPPEVQNLLKWVFENVNIYIKGRVLEFGFGDFTISSIIKAQGDAMAKLIYQKINHDHLSQASTTRSQEKATKNIILSHPDFDHTYLQWFQTYDTVIAIDIVTNRFYAIDELENAMKFLKKDGRLITIVPANTITFSGEEVDVDYLKKENTKSIKKCFTECTISKIRLFNINDNSNSFDLLTAGLAALTVIRKH